MTSKKQWYIHKKWRFENYHWKWVQVVIDFAKKWYNFYNYSNWDPLGKTQIRLEFDSNTRVEFVVDKL